MEMLNVNKLCKNYGDIKALKSVSFSISKGEIFGYIGPNGSGKTTTIKIICGLTVPNSENVEISGLDDFDNFDNANQKIGLVMENHGLYPGLTAFENLEFFDRLFGDGRSRRKARIEEALKIVDLYDRKDSLVRTYSKGMQRKLSMIRAMFTQPKILILDEPFDGIDVESRHNLIEILRDWVSKEEKCILMTSHNMADVEAICSNIAIIKNGEIIGIDTINNFRKNKEYNIIEIVLNKAPDNNKLLSIIRSISSIKEFNICENKLLIKTNDDITSSELASKILHEGFTFSEIRNVLESMEDIYLRMVGNQ